jgi:UDP-N-acetylmuramate dehydrogenase
VSFSSSFDDILEENVVLAGATTLGIGGPARMLARPRSREELARLLGAAGEAGLRVRVLGAGSNLLIADEGVDGVVVKLAGRRLATLELLPGAVRCGAGLALPRLVRETCAGGLSGLEGLAGIPGALGGALRMNAGGHYGAIGDAVREIHAVDLGGAEVQLTAEQAGFGYRRSDLEGLVLTGCVLDLTAEDPETVRRRAREVLEEKRACQPLNAASAGCVFRNPPGDVAAGRLIEELGFKGRRAGGAKVSELHANYIVNTGGARCGDVLELIDAIREAASRERGIHLELELEIWS